MIGGYLSVFEPLVYKSRYSPLFRSKEMQGVAGPILLRQYFQLAITLSWTRDCDDIHADIWVRHLVKSQGVLVPPYE